MSDDRTILSHRISETTERIAAACRRAGREPGEVTLVGVSKFVPTEIVAIAAELGLRDLGESRPQELWKKADAIPGVRWHVIGHLQRNKLDRTLPLAHLIHSVDSRRLLDAIHAFGIARGNPVPVLLEVNCSREPAKGGFAPEEILALGDAFPQLAGVRVDGLMTMAAFHDDPADCRPTFAELRELRNALRTATGLPLPHLSMGMSHDFVIAVEEGATFVRIGSSLFANLESATPNPE